jgi:homoserine dehydrogenase
LSNHLNGNTHADGLRPIVVLKFGSSVLPHENRLTDAVDEIDRISRRGHRVVAVVSAFGSTTDDLIAHAKCYSQSPPEDCLAALLATGEARSVALLGLALHRAGIDARVLDSAAIGLRTSGPTLDAQAVSLDAAAVLRGLDEAPVLVVPGFVGRCAKRGHATLLGRGGSDLSALFIAAEIGASCRLLKDVDGLYDRDPAEVREDDEHPARRFATVTYRDVLGLDEGIIQHKAVRYAQSRALEFTVSCLGAEHGTLVGHGPSVFSCGGRFQPITELEVERSAA